MPDLPDLPAMSDEDLDTLRTAVLNEQERRQRLATAPTEVARIAERYAADGGDRADLVAALDA